MKCLGHLCAFTGGGGKVQIRPHSIKSVKPVLKGLSALVEAVDKPAHYNLMHCRFSIILFCLACTIQNAIKNS